MPRPQCPIDLPTEAELGALVSAQALQRGSDYARVKRVTDLFADASGVFGTVNGQRAYHVMVGAPVGDGLTASCSCPAGAPCEHVVALILSARRHFEPRAPSPPPSPLPPGLPRLGHLELPIPADALQRWAAMNDCVSDLKLERYAYAAGRRDAVTYGGRLSVAEALQLLPSSPTELETTRAIVRHLLARSEAFHAARAKRAARRAERVPPVEPLLAQLWAEAAAHLAGGEDLSPVAPPTIELRRRPFRLIVSARARCPRCAGPGAELTVLGAGQLEVPGCEGSEGSPCPVRVAGLEALRDAISAEPLPAAVHEYVAGAFVPDWLHRLRRLDPALAPPEEPSRLNVRVTFRPYPRVECVTVVEKKKGGVTLRPQKELPLDLAPEDLVLRSLLEHGSESRNPATIGQLLYALAGTDRVWNEHGARIAVVAAEPRLALRADPAQRDHTELMVSLGPHEVPLPRVGALGDAPFLVVPSPELTAVHVGLIPLAVRRVAMQARGESDLSFPSEAVPELLRRVVRADPAARIPEALGGKPVDSELTPVVQVRWARPSLFVSLGFRHHADYPVLPPGADPPRLWVSRTDGTVGHIDRALDAEHARAARIASWLGLDDATLREPAGDPVPADRIFDVVSLLAAEDAADRPEGLEVLWAKDSPKISLVQPSAVSVRVSGNRDWFAIGGEVAVDGKSVPLPLLLRAIRDQQSYVQLSPEQVLAFSRSMLDAFLPLSAAGEPKAARGDAETWRVGPLGALALEGLEEEGVSVEAPEAWSRLLESARSARTFNPEVPAGLHAELRPYQRAGFDWLARLATWAPGACLCDDMGLGKTVQAIALLLSRVSRGPALVLAPTSVGFNWARELERFAPSLAVSVFRGAATLGLLRDAASLGPGSVLVTNYELLVLYAEDLTAVRWGTLVLDEAQAVKNAATQRARVAAGLRVEFRLALTGTPVENRADELWSLFNVTLPGLLGSAEAFRERFGNALDRQHRGAVAQSLARAIRPFVLRRLKREVARELPPRTDVTVEIELSSAEQALYARLRKSALDTLAGYHDGHAGQRRIQVLVALMRLRQAACHPRLLDPASAIPSSKLAALLERVDELRAEGHRALVFSQFTTHLALVREALDSRGVTYRYLDGATPAGARQAEVDAFQRGQASLFLLSLKAGGTGLNLTGADYVIHLDPWWNPAVEDQATDRAHRIGQTRPVTVYRLVARGTIEEGILALHKDKRELVAALLDGADAAAALSTDELVALIESSAGEVALPPEPALERPSG